MEIAIIAHDTKKELMTQFCIAYCGILSKHNICATGTTGKFVEEATGLKIDKCLAGMQGGEEQISARVAYNEIDLVLFSVIRCPTHSTNRTSMRFPACVTCTISRLQPTRQPLKCSSSVWTAVIWIGVILSTPKNKKIKQ